ncbi:4'-phosphopantetheinyl transferase family protein [Symbioplanes lichenis]|uniref:4'-phosphopantetheinyl transferase family protein n=1 Tax=Symbioplanes lichenis TaxID=1629072 RepID=UPI0027394AA7|nr:4'-phosphopantetheinyl transferase superfamily protein [Actinoplanes lichenis]
MTDVPVRIVVAKLPPDPPPASLFTVVSPQERESSRTFRTADRRAQFLAGRLLARHALRLMTEAEARATVLRDERGRPFFAPPYDGVHLTIAHTSSVVVAGCSPEPIGIDVETLRDIPYAARLAVRTLPAALAAEVAATPVERRSRAFLRHWTALEARAKVTGAGVQTLFRVDPDPAVHIRHVPVGAGSVVALAALQPNVREVVDDSELW